MIVMPHFLQNLYYFYHALRTTFQQNFVYAISMFSNEPHAEKSLFAH